MSRTWKENPFSFLLHILCSIFFNSCSLFDLFFLHFASSSPFLFHSSLQKIFFPVFFFSFLFKTKERKNFPKKKFSNTLDSRERMGGFFFSGNTCKNCHFENFFFQNFLFRLKIEKKRRTRVGGRKLKNWREVHGTLILKLKVLTVWFVRLDKTGEREREREREREKIEEKERRQAN